MLNTVQCAHNNYSSCSWSKTAIVHHHHCECSIYNHARDPFSGSALIYEPSLNPEAEGCCQQAGFAASTAYILKHIIALTCVIIEVYLKEMGFLWKAFKPMHYVSERHSEKDGWIRDDKQIDDLRLSQNSHFAGTLCNLPISPNTETWIFFFLLLSCLNNILGSLHQVIFCRVCV